MSKPKNLTMQGFQTLLNLIAPTINAQMTAANRATSREVFVNEGLRIVRNRGFEKVCEAIAMRQAVDTLVKRRSDMQLPPLEQFELLPTVEAIEKVTGDMIFEDGDRTITPFPKMIAKDWSELVKRADEHASMAVARSAQKHVWQEKVVPFIEQGLTTAEALVEVWREAESKRRKAG